MHAYLRHFYYYIRKHKKCIRQYTWTLDNLVDSLNNASNVLYETDQQAASEIEEQ